MNRKKRLWLAGSLLLFLCSAPQIKAQPGLQHPLDHPRALHSYFPFDPPNDLATWQTRRQDLRNHVQVSLGLWPMPEKTPLLPVIHGRIDMGAYTVEKVYFQSFPDFFVTGNLYRPKNTHGKVPGILCPHGHFPDGRFRWANDQELAIDLESGAEQFESNGRSPLQARCANLATLGCVVFHYDMLGYADSQQITHALAHGFREQRVSMNDTDRWGFFSPQAESRLQSIMGLQTWNSIRSLDFLCSLPDVDESRIGVTGGSGGGTQTFILCAIDPRPAAAFPAVMVSTAMQGGCTCENCCNLRIHCGNVDIAALFAPKPLGLTAANDWTKEMPTKGFPQLKTLYSRYQENGHYARPPELTARLQFPHNYNQVSREAMYNFFNRFLKLGHNDISEQEIQTLESGRLSVFDGDHPKPDWSEDHERDLLQHWARTSRPKDRYGKMLYDDQLDHFHSTTTVALKSIISHPPSKLVYQAETTETIMVGSSLIEVSGGVIKAVDVSLETRISMAVPVENKSSGALVLRINQKPVKELMENTRSRGSEASVLASRNCVVVNLELSQAETTDSPLKNKLVDNGRKAAGYTFGYNRSLFAWRVSQVLYAIEFLSERFPDREIRIVAYETGFAEVAAMAFAATESKQVTALACRLNGFRFADVKTLEDQNFLPGAAAYGDLPGFLATKYDRNITLQGESEASVELLRRVMTGRGTLHRLRGVLKHK